jgi:small GTP-binding protein
LQRAFKTHKDFLGRILSSQTIGVEFASKVVKVGSGTRRKRIKLQLWDTAGTERFRSVSRSYYRGAAGALLVYDVTSTSSFDSLPTFYNDAKALASPNLVALLVGNKADLASASGDNISGSQPSESLIETSIPIPMTVPSSVDSKASSLPRKPGIGTQNLRSKAPEGREVTADMASTWASTANIPAALEVSAYTGENVDEIFTRLARIILTKIELGEIDPDDPQSGIQYGDTGAWGSTTVADNASIRSGMTMDDGRSGGRKRRRGRARGSSNGWVGNLRDWDDVFGTEGRRQRGCC